MTDTRVALTATSAYLRDDERITCTIAQFQTISGLSASSIWSLIAAGTLQTVAVGRRRLILLDSYRALIRTALGAPPVDCRRNGIVPKLGAKLSDEEKTKRPRGRPRTTPRLP